MRQLLRLFDKAVNGVIFLCIAGFVTLAFLQVICRFVLNDSLTWSEEMCRYLFVWMVFLGAGVGLLHRRHITIDIIPNAIPKKFKKYYNIIIDLFVIAFTFYLIRYGVVFSLRGMRQNSPALQIPLGYVYFGIIFGGVVMLVNSVRAAIAEFIAIPIVEKEPEPQPEMSQEEFNRLLGIQAERKK